MQFPNSSKYFTPCSSLEISFKAAGTTIVFLILILSIFGNSLVCVAVYRQISLRTSSNTFVINLAVTDTVASSVLLPLEALYLLCFPSIPLNEKAITAWNTLFLCFLALSVLNFTAVTVDRYIHIVFPLRYDAVLTSSLRFGMVCGMWIYATLLAVLMYFAFDTPENGVYSFRMQNRFFISFLGINVFFPFCVIVFLYFKIFRLAKHHSRRIFSLRPDAAREHKPRNFKRSLSFVKEFRAAKTIGIVICCFVVTWFPFLVYQLVFIFMDQSSCTLDKLDTVICWFTYLSGVLNPITYAARDGSFRQSFQKIFTCK